jgi:hypothetical protein
MRGRDSERQLAASDVAYEINALRAALDRHLSCGFAWTAWFVHARNLMDFFEGQGSDADDVRARDFFDPPGNWDAIRESVPKPDAYREYRTAANKLAAHLTYSRLRYCPVDGRSGRPPSKEVTDYLLTLAREFQAALPAERRAWVAGETPVCG